MSGIFEIVVNSDAYLVPVSESATEESYLLSEARDRFDSSDIVLIPAFLDVRNDLPVIPVDEVIHADGDPDLDIVRERGYSGATRERGYSSAKDGPLVRERGYSFQIALEDIPLPMIPVEVPVVAPSGKVKLRTLNIAPLVAIMYFAVAGGPEGTETMIQNGGPLFTIVGIILCSLLWAAPTALMTAELSTRYPENGGFVIWANVAWGKFASGMAGWLQFCFTASDAALYPGLFLSYLSCSLQHIFSEEVQWAIKGAFVTVIMMINLSGASVVGHSSMLLMACIILPFLLAVLISFTGVFTGHTILGAEFHASNWLETSPTFDLPSFLNVLLWNMGMWESASVCVGEVQNVPTAFPYALAVLVVVVVLNYLIPIMAFTALSGDSAAFVNGYYITIVRNSISPYFAYILGLGQCISSVGLFTSGIFKNAFMICGMGEQGMLPKTVSARLPNFDSPYIAILLSLCVTLPVMSLQTFGAILGVEMVIYCLSLLLEISSLLRLRYITEEDEFDRKGTYMIPLSGVLFPMYYLPSVLLCLYVIAFSDTIVWIFSGVMVGVGAVLILVMQFLETARPDLFAETEGVVRHVMKKRRTPTRSGSRVNITPLRSVSYGSMKAP